MDLWLLCGIESSGIIAFPTERALCVDDCSTEMEGSCYQSSPKIDLDRIDATNDTDMEDGGL